MSKSYSKIWIHAVFGTKFRQSLIKDHFKNELYSFINSELLEMNCKPKIINGTEDHSHILFRMPPQQNVSDIMKNIKGSSSHWINENSFIPDKFLW